LSNCGKRLFSREKLDGRKQSKTSEEAENRGVAGSIPALAISFGLQIGTF
jgi:hypothetical protein